MRTSVIAFLIVSLAVIAPANAQEDDKCLFYVQIRVDEDLSSAGTAWIVELDGHRQELQPYEWGARIRIQDDGIETFRMWEKVESGEEWYKGQTPSVGYHCSRFFNEPEGTLERLPLWLEIGGHYDRDGYWVYVAPHYFDISLRWKWIPTDSCQRFAEE